MGADPVWEPVEERLGGHWSPGAIQHREHLPASVLQVQLVVNVLAEGRQHEMKS